MPFKPGQSGNPAGRPRGSRNKRTIVAEQVFDDRAGEVTQAAIDLAKQGHGAALRVCMDRVAPPLRDRPLDFDLPALRTAADAVVAASAIVQGAAQGELTVREAAGLMKMVRDFVAVLKAAADLEQRSAPIETADAQEARRRDDRNREADVASLDLGDAEAERPAMSQDNPPAIAAVPDRGLPSAAGEAIRNHGKPSRDRHIPQIGFVLHESENGCAGLPTSRESCAPRRVETDPQFSRRLEHPDLEAA